MSDDEADPELLQLLRQSLGIGKKRTDEVSSDTGEYDPKAASVQVLQGGKVMRGTTPFNLMADRTSNRRPQRCRAY